MFSATPEQCQNNAAAAAAVFISNSLDSTIHLRRTLAGQLRLERSFKACSEVRSDPFRSPRRGLANLELVAWWRRQWRCGTRAETSSCQRLTASSKPHTRTNKPLYRPSGSAGSTALMASPTYGVEGIFSSTSVTPHPSVKAVGCGRPQANTQRSEQSKMPTAGASHTTRTRADTAGGAAFTAELL